MTERFTIAEEFGSHDRAVLEEAVKKSNLPEGVTVLNTKGIETATKPFVVVVAAPYAKDATKAFRAGAIDYVELTLDVDEMTQRLSSK